MDLEDWFQQWRFRHMTTVKRIIGFKRGTGGTAGVGYLAARSTLTSSRNCGRSAPSFPERHSHRPRSIQLDVDAEAYVLQLP